jgi:hypothetical protein
MAWLEDIDLINAWLRPQGFGHSCQLPPDAKKFFTDFFLNTPHHPPKRN